MESKKLWASTYAKIMKAINKFDPKNAGLKKYMYLCYMRAFYECFPNTFFIENPAVKSEDERDD